MNRYAVIDVITRKVVNIAVWDGVTPWHPGHEREAVQSNEAEVGWSFDYETGALVPPIDA